MENITIPPNSNTTNFTGSAAPKTINEAQQAPQVQRVSDVKESQDSNLEFKGKENESKEDLIKRASHNAIKNSAYFVVSDTKFTIYKDTLEGETVYFTRITSLRDGSVETIPEQNLLANYGGEAGTLYQGSV